MRDLLNIVTEDTDAKALKARYRHLSTERRHLVISTVSNSAARAAQLLADGQEAEFAIAMKRIEEVVRKIAEFDREMDQIDRTLNPDKFT